jgi:ATP-dependent Clp protease ATP-binding subunit ClpB
LSNPLKIWRCAATHQRLTPEHLLKVLLEDKEGLCANLIRAAGSDPQPVLLAVDAGLDKQPKVEGSGAGQVYLSPELARIFDQAEKIAEGRRQLCHGRAAAVALAMAPDTPAGKALAAGVFRRRASTRRSRSCARAARRKAPRPRKADALKKYARDLTEAAREGQARPGDRPRRRDPPHDPGAVAPHQNNPVLIGEPGSARPRSSKAWRCASSMATCRRA